MQAQRFFIFLGYPGSGKSHFARKLAAKTNIVRLNGDGLRHAVFDNDEDRNNPANQQLVFGALDYAVQQVLLAGHSIIYDASHNKLRDRVKAAKLAEPYNIQPIIIWVKVPIEVAKSRLQNREYLPDQPHIPFERFDQLVASLMKPKPDERYIVIDGTAPFDQQFTSFEQQEKLLSK